MSERFTEGLTPFFGGPHPKLNKKVIASNRRRYALEEKADKRFSSLLYNRNASESEKFYAKVRRDYHIHLYNYQALNNCVASKKQQQIIYKNCEKENAEINKKYRKGHVPKKYR